MCLVEFLLADWVNGFKHKFLLAYDKQKTAEFIEITYKAPSEKFLGSKRIYFMFASKHSPPGWYIYYVCNIQLKLTKKTC